MFDDLLHGTNIGNITDIDKELLSPSKSPDMCDWISTVDTSDLTERQLLFTKKELYSRIRVLALREKFQFQVSRSSLKMLTIVRADDNCKWMLRASSFKQSAIFMIRKFNNVHTCSIDYRCNAHRYATSSIIAEQNMGKLDNTYGSYNPIVIARDMEREFGVKISYHQARLGKVAALHMLHGTQSDNFQKLSSYCHVLGESNPGTVLHIEVDSRNRFNYLFLAFGASIQGYLHYLRPVICIDDSHLKGTYKGTLLLAIAQDANEQIYPLTWGIVDAETNRSWIATRTYRTEEFERLIGQLRRVSARAYGCLELVGFPFWSLGLFVGQRYNILTNNNAESLNSMLRHAHSLPIMCLVEHIRHTMQKRFYECRANATACNNLTEVGISNDTDIIDFSENTCTCREFQLNRRPCIHASRAACLRGKSLYDLSSSYYTSEYWKGAYGEAIYPVDHPHDVSDPDTSVPHGSENALAAVDLVITGPNVRTTLYHVRCKQHFYANRHNVLHNSLEPRYNFVVQNIVAIVDICKLNVRNKKHSTIIQVSFQMYITNTSFLAHNTVRNVHKVR
ncbi:uncharacterized protein LOC111411333 [Olea europaea var. sylvestris]|uniref:uncharacterized protein LOC111411333 n=1 Tax=Olea europaea var. sylvestris TaxID=158386 RepID=UPI000C1CCD44|nr:uncharacterized protein LOC111411333 [Olea europaea var. sylvestris]